MKNLYSRKVVSYIPLCLGVLILLVTATYKLEESPAIWYDEGFYTQLGINVAHTGQQALEVAPGEYVHNSYISVGYPLIYPLALSYKFFGIGVLQGRAVMVVFLCLFAAASYFVIRSLFGGVIAGWTLLLIATFPMLYGNGKSVLGEVPGLFFLMASLAGLAYLEKNDFNDWRGYVGVGLFTGLCIATKPIFILFLLALGITLLVRWKKVSLNWQGFALGCAAFIIPIVVWVYSQIGPDITLQSLVAGYGNPYSTPDLLAFALSNIMHFLTESTPLFTGGLVTLWALSLYVRRQVSTTEIAAFIFCLLIILSYLRLPNWYRYLFPATMVALAFLPGALSSLYERVQNMGVLRRFWWAPYVLIALLAAAQLYQTAFDSYVAQYYSSTKVTDVSAAFKKLPADSRIFLYETPELAVLLQGRPYYQYLAPLPTVKIGADSLSALQQGIPDFVVVDEDDSSKRTGIFKKYRFFKNVNHYDILEKTP